MLLGSGVIEFGPDEFFSTDASGRDSLGRVQYRMQGNRVYAVPQPGGVQLLAFEILGHDRIREALVGGDCTLVRVGAAAVAARPEAVPAPSDTTTPAANRRTMTGTAPGAAPQAGPAGPAGQPIPGAAFRRSDGRLYHVSQCQGTSADALCKPTSLHLHGLRGARRPDAPTLLRACAVASPASCARVPTTGWSSPGRALNPWLRQEEFR